LTEEDELEEIRRRKLEELQKQALQKKLEEQKQKEYEEKKYQLMRIILSPESRQRLENIRMVRPQFAEQIELQLIQLYQSGRLRGAVPLSDEMFKQLLQQLNTLGKKREFKIKK